MLAGPQLSSPSKRVPKDIFMLCMIKYDDVMQKKKYEISGRLFYTTGDMFFISW